jgi:hypothetical protein
MATRATYPSTTTDYPPREDLFSWLPAQPPTSAPSPFLSPEQSLPLVPESPNFHLVSLAAQEGCRLTPDSVLSITPRPQDKSQAKGKGRRE